MAASTPTSRRIVIESPKGEHLRHMVTEDHGWLPLTNPGHFAYGVYRGQINQDGTATIKREES